MKTEVIDSGITIKETNLRRLNKAIWVTDDTRKEILILKTELGLKAADDLIVRMLEKYKQFLN